MKTIKTFSDIQFKGFRKLSSDKWAAESISGVYVSIEAKDFEYFFKNVKCLKADDAEMNEYYDIKRIDSSSQVFESLLACNY